MSLELILFVLAVLGMLVGAYFIGKDAGVNSERLKHFLEHEKAKHEEESRMAEIDKKLEDELKAIEEQPVKPASLEAIDELLKRMKS